MIDPPVVKRAQRTLKLAISYGKITADWRATTGKIASNNG